MHTHTHTRTVRSNARMCDKLRTFLFFFSSIKKKFLNVPGSKFTPSNNSNHLYCYILVNILLEVNISIPITTCNGLVVWKPIFLLLSIRNTRKPLIVNGKCNDYTQYTSRTRWQQIKIIVLSGWLHHYRLQLVCKGLDLLLVCLLTLVGLLGECGINNNSMGLIRDLSRQDTTGDGHCS